MKSSLSTHSAFNSKTGCNSTPETSLPGGQDNPPLPLQSDPVPDTLPAQYPAAPGPHWTGNIICCHSLNWKNYMTPQFSHWEIFYGPMSLETNRVHSETPSCNTISWYAGTHLSKEGYGDLSKISRRAYLYVNGYCVGLLATHGVGKTPFSKVSVYFSAW